MGVFGGRSFLCSALPHVTASSLTQNKRRTEHCPAAWLIYIQFEANLGNARKAKSLFFKAIASCPWSKGGGSAARVCSLSLVTSIS